MTCKHRQIIFKESSAKTKNCKLIYYLRQERINARTKMGRAQGLPRCGAFDKISTTFSSTQQRNKHYQQPISRNFTQLSNRVTQLHVKFRAIGNRIKRKIMQSWNIRLPIFLGAGASHDLTPALFTGKYVIAN